MKKKGLVAYKDLMYELVSKDIKLKYRRSILGYLWSILNPLMIMLVMVLVFSSIFRFDVENYPVYIDHRTDDLQLCDECDKSCHVFDHGQQLSFEKGLCAQIYFPVF